MQPIAEFKKVSFKQFLSDLKGTDFYDPEINETVIYMIWNNIKIPQRATIGSAGYDFFLPVSFSLEKRRAITIPTGIRAEIQPGWMLMLVPRSGLGFKHGMRLMNTCGIIDCDYAFAENEGHIMARITSSSNMCMQADDRFIQGVFLPYGLARDDEAISKYRTGGFGSTGV